MANKSKTSNAAALDNQRELDTYPKSLDDDDVVLVIAYGVELHIAEKSGSSGNST